MKRITGWFNSLEQPGTSSVICAGGYASTVTFTFRSSTGSELATADAPPVRADSCDPIRLIIGGQGWSLVDRAKGMALIDYLKRLLGPRFRPVVGYLG